MKWLQRKLHEIRSNKKALGLVVAVLFGFAGLSYLLLTQAATPSGPIVGIGNKCLDNYANLKKENNPIQLHTCNKTNAQVWKVNDRSRTIVNANGFCLTAAGRAEQSLVTLNKCNRSDLQKWVINSLTNTIVSAASGLCLDDKWALTTDGNPIWLYKCNGTVAQVWKPQSNVVQAPSITTFTATPISVTTGATSTLNWSTENATTCSVTPGGPVNTMATSWTTPALTTASTFTYTLTCTNSVGALVTKTVSVTAVAPVPAPPPVISTGTLFGACPTNPGGASLTAAQTVAQKFGGIPAVRQFNGAELTWNATPAKTAVHRSWKPAASVTNAQIDTLLRAADADAVKNGVKHILTFWHEPDNDSLSAGARADRIALINRLHERKVALGLKNVQTSVIFTGGFFASYGSQANRDLWNGVKGDLVGLDADGVHTTTTSATDYTTKYDDEVANVKKFMATNIFVGWTVPEFGTSRQNYFDPTGSKRAAWMKYWGEYFAAQGAAQVLFYDYDTSAHNGTTDNYNVIKTGTSEFTVWKALIAKNTL
jgi:hypothetical protein